MRKVCVIGDPSRGTRLDYYYCMHEFCVELVSPVCGVKMSV